MASRADRYAIVDQCLYHQVAPISSGNTDAAASASIGDNNNKNTATPTHVASPTTAETRPLCTNCDSASTSVVIRVITRPSSSLS